MKPKQQPTIIVRAEPGRGYRWKVLVDGEAVGTDSAATELEARNAANSFAARIARKPFPGP